MAFPHCLKCSLVTFILDSLFYKVYMSWNTASVLSMLDLSNDG